ncbi:histone deacetylase [Plakobranchus ocellatus]|uniref:Histone deacetylase n=1 Tax=Plakobranchus ocellatus TaxID=259542 RepID=A0AAV4BPJ6_9GAST|nr:histone deacetylase [Plakobranchus ocellatus]
MAEQSCHDKETDKDLADLPEVVATETPPDTGSSSGSDDEDFVLLKKLAAVDFEDRKSDLYAGTGFTYSDLFSLHRCEWDPFFPENPQRVLGPIKRCKDLGLVQRCKPIEICYTTVDTLLTKHSQELVDLAESTVNMTQEQHKHLSQKYDSFFCNKHTYEASLAAAGSVINMTKTILQGTVTNGFAMVRPPGHHAQESEFNGYCTFNNVALAAQAVLDGGLDKILILDWDVHHGQGVQQMFYDDPRVLYISIHRYEYGKFWPNLRESDYDYIGRDKGKGFNVNIPLNKVGMTDTDYLSILHQLILPLAYEFSPQVILIASGYDAALGCPEGEMLLTPAMYAHLTHHMMALAAGRVSVALEGGYCLESLAESCALTLRALLQDPCPQLEEVGEPSDSITSTILNVVKVLRPHWNCFAHYKTTSRSKLCPFHDVNSMPPVPGIEFSTPENRPETFDLAAYPVQEASEKEALVKLVDQAIAATDLSVAENRCCYVFDANMRAHKTEGHPEQPDRISAIYTRLAEWRLLKRLLRVPSRLARKSELLWIHTEDYIQELVMTETMEESEIDSLPIRKNYISIYMNQKSLYCALLSCGSVLNMVEAILTKQVQSGVAIVRPPGHHAECSKAMGFCFFNNVAVAAKFAQHHFGLKRILIVDWDIHHGNATQHQFYDDPSVLYISLHRFDGGFFFPGSQDANLDRCGEGPGLGFNNYVYDITPVVTNANIPTFQGRMGDAEYITAFTQIVMPIAYQFNPELVLVSAGFDAAIGDPLGNYRVTPAGYGHMTHMLMGLANGRVGLILEVS